MLRNFVWIQNAQLTRETLALDKDDPKRSGKIFYLLCYTALSFVLYIFAFLIIVGGNVWFLLALLCGNLLGTYFGMSRQKADEHVSQAGPEMFEMASLLKRSRCASDLSDAELNDILAFRKELKLFLESNNAAQLIITRQKNNNIKF